MPKVPRLSSRKLLSILLKLGFYQHHSTGSHANLRHESKTHLHVVIPLGRTTLAPKTLKSILAQAELKVDDLVK